MATPREGKIPFAEEKQAYTKMGQSFQSPWKGGQ